MIVLPSHGPVAASPPTSTSPVLPETVSGPATLLPQSRTKVAPRASIGPATKAPSRSSAPPGFTVIGPSTIAPGATQTDSPAATVSGPNCVPVTHGAGCRKPRISPPPNLCRVDVHVRAPGLKAREEGCRGIRDAALGGHESRVVAGRVEHVERARVGAARHAGREARERRRRRRHTRVPRRGHAAVDVRRGVRRRQTVKADDHRHRARRRVPEHGRRTGRRRLGVLRVLVQPAQARDGRAVRHEFERRGRGRPAGRPGHCDDDEQRDRTRGHRSCDATPSLAHCSLPWSTSDRVPSESIEQRGPSGQEGARECSASERRKITSSTAINASRGQHATFADGVLGGIPR